MPDFVVTFKDGRKVKLTGDKPPTPEDVDAIYQHLGPAEAPQPGRVRSAVNAVGSTAKSLAEGFNPMHREGRENIAGMVGSAAGVGLSGLALAPEAAASGGAALALAPAQLLAGRAMGASVAGALEAGAENLFDRSGKSGGDIAKDVMGSASRQMLYEAVGSGLMMLPARLARAEMAREIAPKVVETIQSEAKAARAKATQLVRDRTFQASESFRAATTAATKRVTEAKQWAQELVDGAQKYAGGLTEKARAGVAAATKTAADKLAAAEMEADAAVKSIQSTYERMVSPAMSPVKTAAAVKDVVSGLPGVGGEHGPARRALDAAGQRVKEAAKSGPELSLGNVQSTLRKMWNETYPSTIFPLDKGEPTRGIGFAAAGMANAAATAQARGKVFTEEAKQALAKMLGVEESHPLPGILGKIMSAPDKVPFADAHALKEELYSAVNFDVTAKKRLAGLTKGIAGTLRKTMAEAGHQAYEDATAAYQAVIPLYQKGVGRQIIKNAATNPDAVAKALKADAPGSAQAIKDLLLHQSEKGGSPEVGQRAWDAVRSAFTYNHVVTGGLDGLSKRVEKLQIENPDFVKVVFGDQTGAQVLGNLSKLGKAWDLALASAKGATAAAKTVGKDLVREAEDRVVSAKDAGNAAVSRAEQQVKRGVEAAKGERSQAVEAARGAQHAYVEAARADADKIRSRPIARAEAFKKSSVSQFGSRQQLVGEGADVIRTASGLAGGLHAVGSAVSAMRLLTRNAKMSDIVEWAAYSNANTNRLARFLAGDMPNKLVPNFLRDLAGVVHANSQSQALDLPQESADDVQPDTAQSDDALAAR